MAAYYNENDPYCAQWLRNLIAAGLIAPGEVDERSIVDVRADDLRGFTQCHFFAGIGVWSYALRLAGWSDDRPVWTGSCPCQPFSAAGKGQADEDDRHLAPVWLRLIRECRPAVVFGEQVGAAIRVGWLDALFTEMELMHYACGAVDFPACSVGAPHIRQRLYFVADSSNSGRQPREGDVRVRNANDGARATTVVLGAEGAACELADSASPRQDGTGKRNEGSGIVQCEFGEGCSFGELGDAVASGCQRQCGSWQERVAQPSTKSFWSDAEWLPCIDGKARPTQPIAQQMADGSSESLGRLRPDAIEEITKEITRVYATEDDARKAVFALRKAIATKAMEQRGIRGRDGVWQAPILFAFLLQLQKQGWSLAEGLPRSGKKDAWSELRGVRGNEASACPSCQRGLDEQRPVECSNAVHLLSSILARHAQANWGEAFEANAEFAFPLIVGATSRVGRLRAYGNAIVAPQTAEFIRAYMTLEAPSKGKDHEGC